MHDESFGVSGRGEGAASGDITRTSDVSAQGNNPLPSSVITGSGHASFQHPILEDVSSSPDTARQVNMPSCPLCRVSKRQLENSTSEKMDIYCRRCSTLWVKEGSRIESTYVDPLTLEPRRAQENGSRHGGSFRA